MYAYSQYDGKLMREFFFGRLPNARAEALGTGYSAVAGDVFSTYYNPASLYFIDGIEFNNNYATPYYSFEKGKYTYSGVGYAVNDKIKLALSRFSFNNGEYVTYQDFDGNDILKTRPYTTNYSLSVASHYQKKLYFGMNTNLLLHKIADDVPHKSLSIDLGVLKVYQLPKKEERIHSLNIAASVSNITKAKMKFEALNTPYKYELPAVFRFALCHIYASKPNLRIKNLRIIQTLYHVELQNLINYKYLTAYRIGIELTLFEIISLRFGRYNETRAAKESTIEVSHISEKTYGFGLNIPVEKLFKNNIPLTIRIDYANLPQPNLLEAYESWNNFSTLSLCINYRLKTNPDKNNKSLL